MAYRMKPRSSEMSQEKLDLEAKEQEEFNNGPLSVLNHSVRNNAQVLINCRNNKILFGRIKAFDSHCNMVLENVKEIWTEKPKNNGKAKKNTKSVNRERFIPKLFVRGDSIILVVKNPVITISDD